MNPNPAPLEQTLLGQTLLRQGLIGSDQLHIALREQHAMGDALGRQLVRLGFISEATLRDVLAENLARASVDLSQLLPDAEALALVPQQLARRLKLIPLSFDAGQQILVIASADADNLVALDQLRTVLPASISIETRLASDSEIALAIDQLYGHTLSIDGILHEIETGTPDSRGSPERSGEYAQPIVRLIDALLVDAVKRDASDLHFEPEAGFLRIRYRIDGLLRQIRSLHKSCWPAMVVRLKVMAGLNIAETRAPQDGRISLHISGRQVDFRVSTLPTIHGENVVLRILDRQKGIVGLDQLGLTATQLDLLKLTIARPEGLILVTGPTGSGKTTTLYSILSHLNNEGINIMTLEDPVEYPMPLIRQTAVSEAVRLDFANGVRALLRQDPDVILVGEIRDEDTARMAIQAAMTGHQVFATLHTNSALGAIPRLFDIGIAPGILAGNIIGIIAQRLVRRLCLKCCQPRPAEIHEVRLLGLPADSRPTLYDAQGCQHCDYQGYRGRLALMEVLRFDADLDELIARRASIAEIRQVAAQKHFTPLADDGCRRVLSGETSLAELRRVVDLTDRLSP